MIVYRIDDRLDGFHFYSAHVLTNRVEVRIHYCNQVRLSGADDLCSRIERKASRHINGVGTSREIAAEPYPACEAPDRAVGLHQIFRAANCNRTRRGIDLESGEPVQFVLRCNHPASPEVENSPGDNFFSRDFFFQFGHFKQRVRSHSQCGAAGFQDEIGGGSSSGLKDGALAQNNIGAERKPVHAVHAVGSLASGGFYQKLRILMLGASRK